MYFLKKVSFVWQFPLSVKSAAVRPQPFVSSSSRHWRREGGRRVQSMHAQCTRDKKKLPLLV